MTDVLPPHNEDLLPPRSPLDPPANVLDSLHDRGLRELTPLPPGPPPFPPGPCPRIPVIGALAWDQPVTTYAHLAGFLGGSPDSYTGDLLTLIQKADPGNRAKLARTYPAEVLAWSIWSELTADLHGASKPPTAAALLGLMLIAHQGGARPGDPAGTIAAAAWSPGITDGLAMKAGSR